MAEHVFTVVARGHAVDAQTNTLTLFCVLEQIGSPQVPFAFPELTVATLWRREPGEEGVGFIQRTRLMDPEGKEIFHGDSSFRFDNVRQRSLVTLQMAPFHRLGCYRVEVLLRREDETAWCSPKASYPIEVSLVPEAEGKELFPERAQ